MRREWFNRENFKKFWLMCATSYTVVTLLLAMFQPLGWTTEMTPTAAWQLFIMCFTVSAVMLLWDFVEEGMESIGIPPRLMLVLVPLLRCLAVLLVVLFEGVAFGFYPLAWNTVLGLLPVVVPAFFVTYTVYVFNYHRAKQNANEINEKIKRKNGK